MSAMQDHYKDCECAECKPSTPKVDEDEVRALARVLCGGHQPLDLNHWEEVKDRARLAIYAGYNRTTSSVDWEKEFRAFRTWMLSDEPRHMAHMQAECSRRINALAKFKGDGK